ncbi:hypothetical protein D1871_19690 [Nakamurella silvestris]|nr:hypothetical protein D1871_19690 [Nakamurella silvestris]
MFRFAMSDLSSPSQRQADERPGQLLQIWFRMGNCAKGQVAVFRAQTLGLSVRHCFHARLLPDVLGVDLGVLLAGTATE